MTALVIAGGPAAPGARAWITGLPAHSVRAILTGDGLAWLTTPTDLEALRAGAHDLALCSQSAREHGLSAARTPDGVRWSSLGTWMAEQQGRPFGWLAP